MDWLRLRLSLAETETVSADSLALNGRYYRRITVLFIVACDRYITSFYR